jgi:hypothetical protein
VSQLLSGQHRVAFFDILGFSNIVSADMTDEEAREKIEHFDGALKYCRENHGKSWNWVTGAPKLRLHYP